MGAEPARNGPWRPWILAVASALPVNFCAAGGVPGAVYLGFARDGGLGSTHLPSEVRKSALCSLVGCCSEGRGERMHASKTRRIPWFLAAAALALLALMPALRPAEAG